MHKPDHKLLARIKGRCRIDELTGCWVWAGGTYANRTGERYPKVWGHDTATGKKYAMAGKRAVWFALGNLVPKGWRVYGTCGHPLCLNPGHIACGSGAELGAFIAGTGKLKGQVRRIIANRKIGRARSKLSPELIETILTDGRSGIAVSRALGINRELVSKARRGDAKAWQPVTALGGMFSGLIREAA